MPKLETIIIFIMATLMTIAMVTVMVLCFKSGNYALLIETLCVKLEAVDDLTLDINNILNQTCPCMLFIPSNNVCVSQRPSAYIHTNTI